MKGSLPYTFECVSPFSFECSLLVSVKGAIFDKVFKMSKKRLEKKLNKKIDAQLDRIEQFEMEERYYKLVKTRCGSFLKDIARQVSQDGINIVNFDLVKGVYEKQGDLWHCRLYFKGGYTKNEYH